MQTQQVIRATGDVTAYGTAVATLVGWLPSIAALFSIIWLSIQITEKATGKLFHELLRDACNRLHGVAGRAWDRMRG